MQIIALESQTCCSHKCFYHPFCLSDLSLNVSFLVSVNYSMRPQAHKSQFHCVGAGDMQFFGIKDTGDHIIDMKILGKKHTGKKL